jgi:hypothetical protein
MSSCVHRSSHLSRHLAALRQQRDLKPGQLAARLGASNLSKVGSMIRAFELGDPISDHWLEKLIAELQPDPAELRRCLELDQAEALEQLERGGVGKVQVVEQQAFDGRRLLRRRPARRPL